MTIAVDVIPNVTVIKDVFAIRDVENTVTLIAETIAMVDSTIGATVFVPTPAASAKPTPKATRKLLPSQTQWVEV